MDQPRLLLTRLCILSNDIVNMGTTIVEFVSLLFDTQDLDPSSKQSLEALTLKIVNSCGLATSAESENAPKAKVKVEVPRPEQPSNVKPVTASSSMFTTVRYISEFCDQAADESSQTLMRSVRNISHLKLLTQFLTISLYEWTFVDCKAFCVFALTFLVTDCTQSLMSLVLQLRLLRGVFS